MGETKMKFSWLNTEKKSTRGFSATGLSLTYALEKFYKAHARNIIKNKAN